jgi:hypothetical protein
MVTNYFGVSERNALMLDMYTALSAEIGTIVLPGASGAHLLSSCSPNITVQILIILATYHLSFDHNSTM